MTKWQQLKFCGWMAKECLVILAGVTLVAGAVCIGIARHESNPNNKNGGVPCE